MFYRLRQDGTILDKANFKYADDCLETNKNIVRGFDGKLMFEEETQTTEYLDEKEKFEVKISEQEEIAQLETRLNELNQDFIQMQCGADFGTKIDENGNIINIADERIAEFQEKHNRLRYLKGKEPRIYKENL